MMKWNHLPLALALMLIVSCGPNESSKEKSADPAAKKAAEKMSANVSMLTNPNRGTPDFLQQIRESLKVIDGVLVVDTPLAFGISVLPVNAPWVIQCGVGMTVVFGNAVSGGDGGSINNDVEIRLSLAPVSKERCKEIAPLLGKEIQTILSAR